ncbi:MAG: TRAP transporter substrate-binding protein DctP [Acidobacteriota bacterium]
MSGPKWLVAAAMLAIATSTLAAADVAIKLGTQAPTNSMWHKALLDMGAAWSKATEKRVTLQVYPDGRAGDEATTIRKMRPAVDSLQAGLLTIGGLAEIDDAFNVLGMPFFFETDDEEQAVQMKLEPRLEQALQAKGFHLVAWGSGGWVQLFSKKPIKSLADVKAAKLYASKTDDRMVQWYTRNGFNPVPLLIADIAPQLKLPTGMIDTAPNTPYLALTTQIYGDAKYMMDLHIAPLVGAMIVSTNAWTRIAAEDRSKVTEAARAMEARIRTEAPKQDADSITAMTAKGLQVIKLDQKGTAEFRAAATDLIKTMRGNMVPAEIFDLALAERDAYRKSKGK